MHKILRLHHHKHTGKLLHHRHTSYHALVLLLAIAGGFMLTMNHMAKAADYQVTATVPAPLPTEAAEITNLHEGDTVYSSTIVLSGTCPVSTPAIIVVAYDGSTLLGSQTCSAGGTFNMPVSLGTVGTHSITVVVMNFTGQTGATSQPLHINYVFPTVSKSITNTFVTNTFPQVPSSAPAQPAEDYNDPRIVADSAFIVYPPDRDTIWKGSFLDGTPPYSVSISWGDGNSQDGRGVQPGKKSFRHFYQVSGTYNVRITLKDSRQRTATKMFTAICPAAFNPQPAPASSGLSIVPYLYGAYLLLILILLVLWGRHHLQHVAQPAYIHVAPKPRVKHISRR